MNLTSKRAERVAISGVVLGLVAFIACSIITSNCGGSPAAIFVTWQMLGTFLMWGALAIYFHQCSRAEQEKLDMAQLAASHQGDTIFNEDGNRLALLNVQQNRLKGLIKWFIPTYGLILAVVQIVAGILFFQYLSKEGLDLSKAEKMLPCALFFIMLSFILFLLSRFATGMSSEKQWSALRAGGSYTLVSSILLALLAISLVLALYNYPIGLVIMAYVTPILITVLGAEIVLNAILDIYRPRVKDIQIRYCIDSRLLGVINEPGGILHTFTSAIDYQFGFKVSQTWFFHLFFQAFLPLVLLFGVIMYMLSGILVVGPGQQAVVERMGKFDENSIVGSGIVFKLPAPFSRAYIYDTDKVKLMNIGFVEDEDQADSKKPLLWGEKHYKEEYNLLVATSEDEFQTDQDGAPVSIVNAAVPIKYKIKDLYKYVTGYMDPDKRLEAICNSELAKYAASAKLEDNGQNGIEKSLIGSGRISAARHLKQVIQRRADEASLGIEIVFVGMQAVHPPTEVASSYQGVVGAYQQKQKEILLAEAHSNKILTEFCGSVDKAYELYDIVTSLRTAEAGKDQTEIEKYRDQLYGAISQARGTVYKTLTDAESYRFKTVTEARAVGQRFAGQIKAYQANPEIYRKSYWYDTMTEALKDVRKYIVASDKKDSEIFIINLEEKYDQNLMDFDPTSIK